MSLSMNAAQQTIALLLVSLFLAGCIDAATKDVDGQESNSTVAIGNELPAIQSLVGEGTISTSGGEFVEILEIWHAASDGEWRDDTSGTEPELVFTCDTISGSPWHMDLEAGDILPSDGNGCQYAFSDDEGDDFNILYRIWT